MKKIKEIMQFFKCFLLNAMKNEENKGNNAIFPAHLGPFSYFGFKTTSQLSIAYFFCIRPLAFLGPFSYFGFETTIQLSVENFFFIDALAHSPISAHSLISLMTEK
jgi:hypothetical protein